MSASIAGVAMSDAAAPSATDSASKFRFAIDRGGTFTDVYAEVPVVDGRPAFRVLKLLSVDPANYADAPREAIRRVLEEVTGVPHPIDQPLDTSRIEWIRMGTTVATNALLERKGERTAFVTTAGFADLLHIGNQSRAKIFDIEIARPENVYERVIEVDERVMVDTVKEGGKTFHDDEWEGKYPTATGITGEKVTILQAPDLAKLESQLREVKETGIVSLAVSLVHSYTFPQHEQLVGELARKIGFTHISLSSALMPMVKLVPRSYTACADAYLTPCIHKYLTQFRAGFDEHMEANTRVWFMQSDGGLVPVDRFSGFRAVLSGPAGGVVGYAQVTPIKPRAQVDDEASTSIAPKKKSKTAAAAAAAKSTSSPPSVASADGSEVQHFDVAQEAVIGFDMGGTSTDVSRFAGTYEHVFENTTAGITIQAAQLDINTVAAGGGSMLFFRNGLFVVGPESASAHPGPTAYRKGGPLTITDANLLLGRLLPDLFPKIFGPTQDQPLDVEATRQKFDDLTRDINAYFTAQGSSTRMTAEEVALGFIAVANETMCRPIRALTQSKGFDIQRHTLSVFGGAGGQHATSIARNLGLRTIFLHRFSGILSAYGLGLADVVQEKQEPCTRELVPANISFVRGRIAELQSLAIEELRKYGFDGETSGGARGQIRVEVYLNLRYAGTDTSVMTTLDAENTTGDDATPAATGDSKEDDSKQGTRKRSARVSLKAAQKATSAAAATDDNDADAKLAAAYNSVFVSSYQREYGFTLSRPVIIDDIRVRAIGHSGGVVRVPIAEAAGDHRPKPSRVVQTYFDAGGKSSIAGAAGHFLDTGVYSLGDLHADDVIDGPAMITDKTSTTLVEPGCRAHITAHGDVEIYVGSIGDAAPIGLELDSIQLSIFSHRFMSIAEQMGRTLQRTSVSTNIRERLDFSCALFGPDGGLVANAPHLPVHLGAMQEAVKFQLTHLGSDWHDGDVMVSNHPHAGGSHLPDITVITPVFSGPTGRPVFFVASRGHHSDIGGISPGSMPPFSKRLYQEGARIVSHKLVTKKSGFDESGITDLLTAPGRITVGPGEPACSGTRNLKDNLSDLRAQVAANQKGIKLMQELIAQYSLPVVQQYMNYIQTNAEEAVREMLCEISRTRGMEEVGTLHADDYMDDGSRVSLSLTIDRRDGSAMFDFTGTSPEVYSNTNAPPAVTYSAIIYCLRCLVKRDIPLNQGCLRPIQINIPKGSFLNPSRDAAVVGGNVLTSQRVTDVVLRAFHACAASQGCMNNFTFGDESFGYYETIAGGAGAGPTWRGQSGVHTAMTNTRITDPEIFERRYPVLLRRFSLRPGSGGVGRNPGGDGIIREVEFLRPLTVGILSERRVFRPYGLEGGGDGQVGENFIITREQTATDDQKDATPAAAGEDGAAKSKRGRAKKPSTTAAAAATESSQSSSSSSYTTRIINIGGKNTYQVAPHDRIRIVTPGGGGWGAPGDESASLGGGGTKRKHDDDGAAGEESALGQSKKAREVTAAFSHGSVAAWQSLQEQA